MLIAHAVQDADPADPGFVHAVALAAHGRARLASVHVHEPGAPDAELPEARVLLQRWGMPAPLVEHERVQQPCTEGVDESLLDALTRIGPDLVVASTHARAGISRLLFGSVAEGVARNLRVPTLLLPLGGDGFVDPDTGRVRLGRMLVPAGSSAEAAAAVRAAVALAQLAGVRAGELVLLHVGDGPSAPELEAPSGFGIRREQAHGAIDEAISVAAEALGPDLVVMVTRGHDGVADVLLASHTERVLHRCRRPLLWVPAAVAGLT
jgi:nucleotide-binding universal stress UspA family protein